MSKLIQEEFTTWWVGSRPQCDDEDRAFAWHVWRAAAEVQQKHMLEQLAGPVTDEEFKIFLDPNRSLRSDINAFIAARLTAPKERVTIAAHCESCTKKAVFLDGERVFTCDNNDIEHLKIYADGLRYRLADADRHEP